MVTLRELYKATTPAAKKMVADNIGDTPPSKDDPKFGGASNDKVFKATNVKASTNPKNPMNEEELDELNQSTLKSYIGKASKSAASAHDKSTVQRASSRLKEAVLNENKVYAMYATITPKDKMDAPKVLAANPHTKRTSVQIRAKDVNHAHAETKKHFENKGHVVHMTTAGNVIGYGAKPVNEENLEELNKNTLSSYIKKSVRDMRSHQGAAQVHIKNALTDIDNNKDGSSSLAKSFKHIKKANNRQAGITNAATKLAKEENLEELKKITLARYIVGASNNKAGLESKIAHDMHTKHYSDDKDMKKSINRSKGIIRASYKLAKEEYMSFAEFIIENENGKDGRSEKNTAVPSASSPEDAEAKAKKYYNLAKSTPSSEPEKKKHYMYIARKLYSKAKALRKTNKVNG